MFLLTLCSCSGGFHPGIFVGNRIRDAKSALNNLADPTAKEAEKPVQEVLTAEKEEVESVEEKPTGEAFKGSAPNSKVFIKSGEYKRKYALVEKEGKKK
ncbi:MAG: hypothetical protein ACD_7C00165G0010 [uncultured bacterium]|nr:MAG: hypothetical protein ACD_7C00165G0010 [uncultured bacterium]HBR78848.1 hypothetical protein [Candidatus Moranbacteria bacterium]